ncbi:MAG TPA: hypothetical protein VMT15_13255 [Bryobacteraceae bacterium]|nr:hypothetical protein [Bryobacteraceae bacterium]
MNATDAAGRWFLHSGIREANGGVARYYRSDLGKNVPVSTEITGYAVSTLSYLHSLTGDDEYRTAAVESARFLAHKAWDASSHTFPFEVGSDLAYFFDVGIIARGLLSTGAEEFRGRAQDAALSLAFDFLGDGVFHPIISLPDKQPLPYEKQWSRSPGCYQLKSALAWLGVGDEHAARMFDAALNAALATYESFLPGDSDPQRVMDRLHPYCYFMEALLYRPQCADVLKEGIARVGSMLREISPTFERSDVCAQLLRVRLIAHHSGFVALDEAAAAEEASRVAWYQAQSEDSRLDGGFWFGRKGGEMMPYMNPVSTAFALQALALWEQHRKARWNFDLLHLI